MACSFQRPSPQKEPKPRVVIACEGEKTERGYFEDLNLSEKLTSVDVLLLEHRGTDPRSVVGQVAEFVKIERHLQGWRKDDTAWAVFDGDEHRQTPGQLVNWNSAIQQARDLKINLAISNPSFEFWYLLHYQDQTRFLHRDQAMATLRNHLGQYEKHHRIYSSLQERTDHAIRRAKIIHDRAIRNDVDIYENPCCMGVAKLVEKLLSLR